MKYPELLVNGSVETTENLVPRTFGASPFEVRRPGLEPLALDRVHQAPPNLEGLGI